MDVALGGHATSFEADDIYNLGQSEAIVILLVSTPVRTYSSMLPTISHFIYQCYGAFSLNCK